MYITLGNREPTQGNKIHRKLEENTLSSLFHNLSKAVQYMSQKGL